MTTAGSASISDPAGADSPSGHGSGGAERQAVMYCPYCAEETLFPREQSGWECRSCRRAFSVRFLGLVPTGADPLEATS